MKYLSLFAGIGGMDLGLDRAGMTCVGQCEIDPYCRRVLAKHWPNVWRWDDVRTLTGDLVREHCGPIDLICGGFPCQDISNAGHKAGIGGARSGLWSEYRRLICELRPEFVIVENVAALLVRGAGDVLGDLADSGFDAEWSVLPACALGAPHTRERLFVVAHSPRCGRVGSQDPGTGGGSPLDAFTRAVQAIQAGGRVGVEARSWWGSEPDVARVVDRPTADVDGPNRAIGRAVVPQVAEFIGRLILGAA